MTESVRRSVTRNDRALMNCARSKRRLSTRFGESPSVNVGRGIFLSGSGERIALRSCTLARSCFAGPLERGQYVTMNLSVNVYAGESSGEAAVRGACA